MMFTFSHSLSKCSNQCDLLVTHMQTTNDIILIIWARRCIYICPFYLAHLLLYRGASSFSRCTYSTIDNCIMHNELHETTDLRCNTSSRESHKLFSRIDESYCNLPMLTKHARACKSQLLPRGMGIVIGILPV